MRDYQPAGVLVASVNGNYPYASNASTDLLYSSSESEVRSPMSTDSQPFPLLTAASSTVSIVSQTQQCDWPEFQESYNSIMDNTNLLDSCAAALNDINSEEGNSAGQPEKVRHEFNRSLSSTTTSSSFSGSDSPVTSKQVEQFTRWLCDIENRVAAQPKLSKIVAMKPKQMAAQLDVHSKIFKEIEAKPCIVKGAKRSEYKSIEDRYHLLYLKVYEVLILLEGLPVNTLSSTKRIFSESFNGLDCGSSANDKEHSFDRVDGDNELFDDLICDKSHSEVTTPVYTETSILSTSIGTYYFNYDDTIEQADNKHNEQLSSTIFENSDKEFTFETDLHSLLNTTESLYLESQDQTLLAEHRPMPQQQLGKEIVIKSQTNNISTKIDFCQLAAQSDTIEDQENCSSLAHHKVYDWLHSKTDSSSKSMSSASLDSTIVCEPDYQLLYRAKSEMDLSSFRSMESSHLTSSLQTSLNCLPSVISPIKCYEPPPTLNESIHGESSLVWDNFQMGHDYLKADEIGLIGSDFETKELSNKLCYFGDDYSLHLNESNTTESELDSDIGTERHGKMELVLKVIETSPTLSSSCSSQNEPSELRRSRRIRKKRLRNSLNTPACGSTASELNSTLSSDQSSETGLSEATTASAGSKLLTENMQTTPPHDEFTPEKTISYNCSDKQFELHTKESAEPKRMKINEMRPEDFYDIVKMCQSNIDCVITVLGADPNRTLTVAYCQQMKYERYQKSNTETCKCKHETTDAVDLVNGPRTKDIECNCSHHMMKAESTGMCVCAWVSHTIAMILNFLIDCWNVFRNMKLYTYLCRVTKALFGSTRYVADHLKSKREIVNAKAIKYS